MVKTTREPNLMNTMAHKNVPTYFIRVLLSHFVQKHRTQDHSSVHFRLLQLRRHPQIRVPVHNSYRVH